MRNLLHNKFYLLFLTAILLFSLSRCRKFDTISSSAKLFESLEAKHPSAQNNYIITSKNYSYQLINPTFENGNLKADYRVPNNAPKPIEDHFYKPYQIVFICNGTSEESSIKLNDTLPVNYSTVIRIQEKDIYAYEVISDAPGPNKKQKIIPTTQEGLIAGLDSQYNLRACILKIQFKDTEIRLINPSLVGNSIQGFSNKSRKKTLLLQIDNKSADLIQFYHDSIHGKKSVIIPQKAIATIAKADRNNMADKVIYDRDHPKMGTGAKLAILLTGIGALLIALLLAIVSAVNEAKKGTIFDLFCFIATMVYGDMHAPEVETLRWYRDHVLRKHLFGRAFIAVYYKTSPLFVRIFRNNEWVKRKIKKILDKKVEKIRVMQLRASSI